MSTRIRVSLIAAIAFALVAHPTACRADNIPLVNFNPDTLSWSEQHGDGMIGWCFSLTTPVTVTGVGWYDAGHDGLSRPFEVGLWKNPYSRQSAVQLLGDPDTGIFIPGGNQAPLNGPWRVYSLPTPLQLSPGDYALGGLDSATTTDLAMYIPEEGHESDPTLTGGRLTIGMFFYAGMDPREPTTFHLPQSFYLWDGMELGPMLFIDGPAWPASPEPAALPLLLSAASLLLRGVAIFCGMSW